MSHKKWIACTSQLMAVICSVLMSGCTVGQKSQAGPKTPCMCVQAALWLASAAGRPLSVCLGLQPVNLMLTDSCPHLPDLRPINKSRVAVEVGRGQTCYNGIITTLITTVYTTRDNSRAYNPLLKTTEWKQNSAHAIPTQWSINHRAKQ